LARRAHPNVDGIQPRSTPTGAGYGFTNHRLKIINYLALFQAFWEFAVIGAAPAGAFHQIADLEVEAVVLHP
jgi:hypothetical protein